MDAFTIRDLRERTGELIRDAEAGKLSIVTKHGQPVFVAVPFDETLLKEGVGVALAVKHEVISLGKAAKLAGMPISEFIDHLGALKISVVRYGKEDLQRELAAFE
jgi:prevent-host-death family protein